jgi:hypothetical protein
MQQFAFIDLFKSALHVSGDVFAHPQEQFNCTRCGNKESGLILLLISGHVDDEEEGRTLTRGLPSTFTQRFIHAHPLVWP